MLVEALEVEEMIKWDLSLESSMYSQQEGSFSYKISWG